MSEEPLSFQGMVCPIPITRREYIILGHGSGGKLSHDLISQLFIPTFANPGLAAVNDAGVVQLSDDTRLAVSTDSHVVSPLFFPGGDIGRLSICGTVNDVAMMGAKPLFVTAGFILEEGLELSILERVVASMRQASQEAGVQIIAGDTKVVQKGKADGLYINTCGVGIVRSGCQIAGDQARPGDVIILSGTLGDHGIAVLTARGELGLENQIFSDVAPLNHLVEGMLQASDQIHVLRDPTRGGLGTTLNEIAMQSNICIWIDESKLPIKPSVNAACEILGFDPLYVANEGKLVAIVAQSEAEKVLAAMRSNDLGRDAVIIGRVDESPAGRVLMKTKIGSTRVVDVPAGEILPRIC